MLGIEVQNMMFASDDVVWISWQYSSEERVPGLPHTNDVIGAFVTAGTRIHLYSYLDITGQDDLLRHTVLYTYSPQTYSL
jgi:hypothetical protein